MKAGRVLQQVQHADRIGGFPPIGERRIRHQRAYRVVQAETVIVRRDERREAGEGFRDRTDPPARARIGGTSGRAICQSEATFVDHAAIGHDDQTDAGDAVLRAQRIESTEQGGNVNGAGARNSRGESDDQRHGNEPPGQGSPAALHGAFRWVTTTSTRRSGARHRMRAAF